MNLSVLQFIAIVLLLIGICFSAIRLFLGPTVADRVAAADTLAVITTAVLVGLAAWFNNPVYLDVALVYGALAFVGTVAIARAIEGDRE
jgi:multisubunit Na+/H+ antiporter MnhF subunit